MDEDAVMKVITDIQLRFLPSLCVGNSASFESHEPIDYQLIFYALQSRAQEDAIINFSGKYSDVPANGRYDISMYMRSQKQNRLVSFPQAMLFELDDIPAEMFAKEEGRQFLYEVWMIVPKKYPLVSQPHSIELRGKLSAHIAFPLWLGQIPASVEDSEFINQEDHLLSINKFEAIARKDAEHEYPQACRPNLLAVLLTLNVPVYESMKVLMSFPSDFVDAVLYFCRCPKLNLYGEYSLLPPIHEFIIEALKVFRPEVLPIIQQVHETWQELIKDIPTEHEGICFEPTASNLTDLFIELTCLPIGSYCIPTAVQYRDYRLSANMPTASPLKVFIAPPMINVEKVLSKYPDIGSDPPRFAWWLDAMMPYAIYRRLRAGRKTILFDIAGLIGFWSVMSESGTGSNSWLLLHPLTHDEFYEFACQLLTLRPYGRVLEACGIAESCSGPTENLNILELLAQKILRETDMDTFQSLEESVKWVKHIQSEYNVSQYLVFDIELVDRDDILPSPSGLTIIPFYFGQ